MLQKTSIREEKGEVVDDVGLAFTTLVYGFPQKSTITVLIQYEQSRLKYFTWTVVKRL